MSTLILNADMTPLSVVPLSTENWKDAIGMVWADDATVIEEYEAWDAHSPSITITVPSVLMLREYQNIKRKVKFSRYNVFLRDLFTCQYCGLDMRTRQNEVTLDHVNPRARGGKTVWDNSITACPECNTKKAHYNDMKPRYKPYKPDVWALAKNRRKMEVTIPHASWIPYIGWKDESLILIRNPGRE